MGFGWIVEYFGTEEATLGVLDSFGKAMEALEPCYLPMEPLIVSCELFLLNALLAVSDRPSTEFSVTITS